VRFAWAITNASYKRQKRNDAVTEIVEMPKALEIRLSGLPS
jgi:hypothetical protein